MDKHAFDRLMPKAIAWAEESAATIARDGTPLDAELISLACAVGVTQPDAIRILLVDALPLPSDPELAQLALQLGLLDKQSIGITLGHGVMLCREHVSPRVLSHEFRHVYQYEQAGSIAAYIPLYLQQILEHGYVQAPYEVDARNHEIAGK